MEILFHRGLKKSYKKLRAAERKRFDERLRIFCNNPDHPILHNHALSGAYRGYRSINIGGDLRALYEPAGKKTAFFITIGTHSELYK